MRKELLDLDKVPFPAWDLVDMKYYLAQRFFGSRVLTMNTSRGCVFKCTFCFNQGLDYQSWRAVGPERMHAQLHHLYEKYNINGVQFYEDSFDINPKRCKGFSDLMINSGLNKKVKWSHFANIPLFKRDVAIHEKKAGMVYIEFGVESGSDRILNWIDKSQSVGKIKEVYEECRQLKIKTAALFIIGFPEESEEEIRATEALVENLPAYILICTIYRPYPGTPLYDYCTSHGMFVEPKNIDEQGEFYRFSHMSEDELNLSNASTKTLLRLQRKFYAKSAIKDLIYCLKTLNLGFILYHVKLHLNPKVLMYSLDSLMKRVIDKPGFAKDFGVAKSRDKYKLYGNFDGSLEQLGFDKVVTPSSRENSKMVLESERDTVSH
ncbi:MAG: radical SAM protein [Candidatus Marinimicrobia bacterium]|nr:radical SAM protein [Candidatus Neomarinimicrobiota bacterium]